MAFAGIKVARSNRVFALILKRRRPPSMGERAIQRLNLRLRSAAACGAAAADQRLDAIIGCEMDWPAALRTATVCEAPVAAGQPLSPRRETLGTVSGD